MAAPEKWRGEVKLRNRKRIIAPALPAGSISSAYAEFSSGVKQFAEKVRFRRPAPKGASDSEGLAVSLKRYPDTNQSFSANCKAQCMCGPCGPAEQAAGKVRSQRSIPPAAGRRG